ncbi:YgaP family membrane protein [Glaciimonas sp. GG7]
MFYAKNMPNWERALRLIMGVMALVFVGMNWGSSDLGIGAGIMGAMLAMTGLFGFCPMCAMVGRKLDKRH